MSERLEAKILNAVSGQPLSFWQLLEKLDSGELETIKALGKLRAKGLVFAGKKIKAKKKRKSRPFRRKALLQKYCKATGLILPNKSKFNQERIALEDVVKKAEFMEKRLDLDNAKIAFLGDDDFCSVAVSLTGKPASATVFEIDPDVIALIEGIAQRNSLKVKCVQCDVRKPLPKRFLHKFDVFVCEPPEALNAMGAFISRGLSLLKGEGCAGYIGLTRLESSGRKWLALQKRLVEANAFVSDALRQFESYPLFSKSIPEYEKMPLAKKLFFNPGKPDAGWWTAALLRVELGGMPRPLKPTASRLYSDEETLTIIQPKKWHRKKKNFGHGINEN